VLSIELRVSECDYLFHNMRVRKVLRRAIQFLNAREKEELAMLSVRIARVYGCLEDSQRTRYSEGREIESSCSGIDVLVRTRARGARGLSCSWWLVGASDTGKDEASTKAEAVEAAADTERDGAETISGENRQRRVASVICS
jgi:hypothetical protein